MARKKAFKNASRPPGSSQAPTARGPRRDGLPGAGQAGGTRQSSSGTNTPSYQPFRGANRGHTLADEARNTAQKRRGALGPDAKLRHKPVTFVCAGFMNPLDDLKLQQKPPSPPVDVPKPESGSVTAITTATVPEPEPEPEPMQVWELDQTPGLKLRPEQQPEPEPESGQDERTAEIEQDVSLQADGNSLGELPPEPSATKENAQNEERTDDAPGDAVPAILSPLTAPAVPVALASTAPADPPQSEEPFFTLDIAGDKNLRPKKKHRGVPVVIPDPDDAGHETDSSVEVILFKGRNPTLQNRAPVSVTPSTPQTRDQDAANSLQLHDVHAELNKVEQTLQASQQPEGERAAETAGQVPFTETPAGPTKPPTRQEAPEEPVVDDIFAKLLDTTQSDDDRAILADYMANMDEEDEDEDMDAHPGLGSHAFHQLRDIGGTDSDAVPDDVDDDDSEEDDMDARLARLLAKQEALGLGSDDIMLFDGAGPVDDDDDDEGWTLAPKTMPRRKKKGSSKTARLMQKKGQFPSASTMADAFDDLDLMDWHRPALNNYRSSQAPICSDSELNEAMQATFQRDRLKKAERKKQREALRAQGLLGKKADPEDPRVLYPGGMSRDELLYELEQFLLGTDEQISLPPLDKAARRCIHQAAQSLKIKSQSAGKGTSRYPVLYRTKATVPYDERSFSSATRYLRATYYPRVDVDEEVVQKYKALNRKDPTAKRGHNAISYREGEVVGQHASELASHNKGRQLLEKMGWTQGTALGTTENKGIMNPIMHRVKKTKAGLGES